MPRVQAIVVRDNAVLMVKHRNETGEWWCLPGGALEPGETHQDGALRELREECRVSGVVVRQTAHVCFAPGDEAFSYLVEIEDQTPALGSDPEVPAGREVLIDVKWLRLCEVPERDRAFLWAAGLLGTGSFLQEVANWGSDASYPKQRENQARPPDSGQPSDTSANG
jgi:8-oxo-dGTP diphosphatase